MKIKKLLLVLTFVFVMTSCNRTPEGTTSNETENAESDKIMLSEVIQPEVIQEEKTFYPKTRGT